MAKSFLDGSNYNFQGTDGSGAAFILGSNPAVAQYAAMMENKQREQLMMRMNAQKQKEARDQRINADISKFSPGEYSQRFRKGIQEGYNSIMTQAKEMQRHGIDPFSDPEFLKKRQELLNRASASKELEKQYTEMLKEYSKNPDAYDNGQQIMMAYNDKDALDRYIAGEFNPGTLQRRYSIADAVKASGATPTTTTIEDGDKIVSAPSKLSYQESAITSLATPQAQYLVRKRGGDLDTPYPAGFPTEGKDGAVWVTEGDSLKEVALNQLEGDAGFMNFLDSRGYDTSSPEEAVKSAMDYIGKQNKAIGGYVNDFEGHLTRNTKSEYKTNFQAMRFDLARKKEARQSVSDNLSIQSKRLDIEGKKLSNAKKRTDLEEKATGSKYGDILTSAIGTGNRDAIEDLNRALGDKGSVKLKGDKVLIESDGVLGKSQEIPLSDTDRIRSLVRQYIPDTQYKAVVNPDIFEGYEAPITPLTQLGKAEYKKNKKKETKPKGDKVIW